VRGAAGNRRPYRDHGEEPIDVAQRTVARDVAPGCALMALAGTRTWAAANAAAPDDDPALQFV